MFVTLVKPSQELKTVSYHKLYDILKQHQNEVNEIRAERLARTANPLALDCSQQQFTIIKPYLTKTLKFLHTNRNSQYKNQRKSNCLPLMIQNLLRLLKIRKLSKEKEIDKLMAIIFSLDQENLQPTKQTSNSPSKYQSRLIR
ncbi:hypothetical protein Tco_0496936 [Tanacetum coccineum]